MLDIAGSNAGRVKLITFKIDTCCFLARHSALIGYGKDFLAQCQNNVTEWDISGDGAVGLPLGKHCTFATNVHRHRSEPVLI